MPRRRGPTIASAQAASTFPIVGIGCSAGGLEALTAFFGAVPAACSMAFVVVQHLDPDRPSSLCELLQRSSLLPVLEAGQDMEVHAGHVYVIPPGKDLSILGGRLQVRDLPSAHGLRLSVDVFLRALAADQKDKAVGVVLSGMGSDGVLGLGAIKEAAGLTLAQEPATATSQSMPGSAIAAGLVDIVAPAHQLPARIADFLRHTPRPGVEAPLSRDDAVAGALFKITALLKARCGNDFSQYKPGTLQRRVERRMALHQHADLGEYLHHLSTNGQELDLLFKELLIGVTSFFRDPVVWEILRKQAIPEMLARHPAGQDFRAWVPACSSGEEAYTLAMVFRDAVADLQPGARYTLQIYATDLDADAIDKARKGDYPNNIAADVGPERLARYFVDENNGYRIVKELRDTVIFAQQNVISDPPFTRLDILSCRNLLIYFGADLQRKVLPLFHYALKRGGLLVLGSAETVGNFDQFFATAHPSHHIFRRLDASLPLGGFLFPPSPALGSADGAVASRASVESIGQLVDQLVQQSYAPAAVLVSADGDILYISGRTGKYLEPAAGRVNINIHAMARPGLDVALASAIRRALAQSEPVLLAGIKVESNGGTLHVDVIVHGLEHPEPLRGRVLVVFKDVAVPAQVRRKPKAVAAGTRDALAAELLESQESLRSFREETQASLEELKSANEELQSTNEELQSANEELTTSKEEMQSMNEEMRTVNTELQSKVHDLTWERNDMANLLNSTEIATIFLDNDMRLRRFTAFATKLFKLIPTDIGRPLSDLVTMLDYTLLDVDAREVLRTLVFSEKEVGARDGSWYRVRIMPYRTQDNMIDGVVSTFINITQTKKLEAELRRLGAAGPF